MTTILKSQLRIDATSGAELIGQLNQVLERIQVQDDMRYGVEPSSRPVRSVATATTLTAGDNVLLVDCSGGGRTVTLMPLADVQGRQFVVKQSDGGANNITLDGAGSETIDGSTTITTSSAYESVTIIATATEWLTI